LIAKRQTGDGQEQANNPATLAFENFDCLWETVAFGNLDRLSETIAFENFARLLETV